MNKSSLQSFTPTSKLDQSNVSTLKQSGLEFKSTKKRALRRPLRSKSTVSSNSAKNSYVTSVNYNTLDNFSIPDSNNTDGCFKQITNMNLVLLKNNQRDEQFGGDYAERGVKRLYQDNNQIRKPIYHYKLLTCHTDRTSNNSQCQQLENSKNVRTDRDIPQKVIPKKLRANTLISRLRSNPPTQQKNNSVAFFNQTPSQSNFSQKSEQNYFFQQSDNGYQQNVINMKNKSTYLPKFGDNLSLQSQKIEKNQFPDSNKYNFAKKKILSKIMSTNTYLNYNDKKFKISEFQLGLSISQDIYGKTYPARHKTTGFILCIKQVIKRQVKHELKKFIQYLKIHSFCNSNYIVDIYGFIQHNDRIYILMEYHNQCQLYLKIKSQRRISARDSLGYIQNICKGIAYLHEKNIAYRNLKPQNISFFSDTCKLSNLCSSCPLATQNSRYVGAIQYCAPELLTGQVGIYQKQCDIWAIGILLYEMVSGTTPWYSLSHKKTINKITSNSVDIDLKVDKNIKKILDKILTKNIKLRIPIQKLLQSIALSINQMQKLDK